MARMHTPGPWHYDPSESRTIIAARDGYTEQPTICDVLDTTEGLEGDDPTADRNGHLIAAAPDLLAACEDFARELQRQIDTEGMRSVHIATVAREQLARVQSIIRKAKGEQ